MRERSFNCGTGLTVVVVVGVGGWGFLQLGQIQQEFSSTFK